MSSFAGRPGLIPIKRFREIGMTDGGGRVTIPDVFLVTLPE